MTPSPGPPRSQRNQAAPGGEAVVIDPEGNTGTGTPGGPGDGGNNSGGGTVDGTGSGVVDDGTGTPAPGEEPPVDDMWHGIDKTGYVQDYLNNYIGNPVDYSQFQQLHQYDPFSMNAEQYGGPVAFNGQSQYFQGPGAGQAFNLDPSGNKYYSLDATAGDSHRVGLNANDRRYQGFNHQGQYFDPAAMGQYGSMGLGGGQYFNAPGMGGYGNDIASAEAATFNRGMNLMRPQLDQQRRQLSQQLANQGLPVGSEAHTLEMNRLEQSQNAAMENLALSSVGAGRQEHSRLAGLNLQNLGFGASEAQRQFGNQMQARQFNSQEQARRFQEDMARRGFQSDEAARRYAEVMGAAQFGESQDARRFQEGLATGQFDASEAARMFGQHERSNMFNAQESARRWQDQVTAAQFNAQEAQRIYQNEFQNQGFNAQEAQRNFMNAFTRSQWDAQEQARMFGQYAQSQGFNAQQQQQAWGNSLAGRQQQIGEAWQARQGRANELMQLFAATGDVENPYFMPTQQFNPMGVDYMGYRQNQQNMYASMAGTAGSALPWNRFFGGGQ